MKLLNIWIHYNKSKKDNLKRKPDFIKQSLELQKIKKTKEY